jgi:hypothetical protein
LKAKVKGEVEKVGGTVSKNAKIGGSVKTSR